jgi:hypothetical protein
MIFVEPIIQPVQKLIFLIRLWARIGVGNYFRARATLWIFSSLAGHKGHYATKIIDTGRLWPAGRVLPLHELEVSGDNTLGVY